MTYELHGIKINCADGISQEEAAIYLNNQLQVMPHKTLLLFGCTFVCRIVKSCSVKSL